MNFKVPGVWMCPVSKGRESRNVARIGRDARPPSLEAFELATVRVL